MDVLDEIKRKINIIDLLKEYIELKKAGANWKALCPFHSEKSPSFMASEDKQIWHCFGCNEGGDIFGFVMRMEGLDFPEALRLLAKRAGVVLRREDPAITSQRSKVLDILDAAASFYSGELLKSPVAASYIKERGLHPETVSAFRLGFSPPGWDNLLRHLSAKGYKPEDIVLAGMILKKEDSTGFYDRFRGRIMFPIANHNGEIVGFTARVLPQYDDGKLGKYINTPETIVYKKSEILYGLNFAKQEIKRSDLAVLVEGNMDVISLHQAGFKNVIATSGTALTDYQVELLRRYTPNVVMSFDADSAGIAAALRGIDIGLSHGLNIRIFEMPKNPDGSPIAKDPDELVKKSPGLWLEAIKATRHIIDFYIDSNIGKYNLSEPYEAAKFCGMIVSEINKLKNGAERSLWIQKLSNITRVPEEDLKEITVSVKSWEKRGGQPAKPAEAQKTILAPSAETKFLSLLVSDVPKFAPYLAEIRPEAITDARLSEFYRHFVIYYNEKGGFNAEEFKDRLAALGGEPLFFDKLQLLKDRDFGEIGDAEIEKEMKILAGLLRLNYLKGRRKALEQEMALAERAGDKTKILELLQKFRELNL
jgi:DNA primase